MDFGALYIHPVEYAQICHGRHSVVSSCRTAVVYERRSLAILNNNYIAFLLDQRSRGRDKPLGIAITDILRLTGQSRSKLLGNGQANFNKLTLTSINYFIVGLFKIIILACRRATQRLVCIYRIVSKYSA